LSDTGLRNYLENNFNILDNRPDKGSLLEMIVFHELQKNTNEEIFFWRTQDKKEVDFVLPSLSRAIEVKYKKNNKKIKSLQFLFDTYSFDGSIISIDDIISKKLI
jgi:predicted AAA+ superfamily ATPase